MPPVRDWMDPFGVPVTILTKRSRHRLRDILFAVGVAAEIFRCRRTVDLVYFLMQGLHLALALPVCIVLGIPVVMKISGSGVIPMMQKSVLGRLELWLLRRWASRVMVLNAGMVAESVAAGFTPSLLTLMPNPVDTTEFYPPTGDDVASIRHRYGLKQDYGVVVYTGRLSPEKGVENLCRSFVRALEMTPKAQLFLVGDGPSRSSLEVLAKSLGLDHGKIVFAGRVDAGGVANALRCSDIFALLSPSEGFSCSLVEAMASGLPSVVSDITANRQLVESGVHGLLVSHESPDQIAGALSRLLADAALRQSMGSAARARAVQSYSTDNVIDLYERIFCAVLSRPAPPNDSASLNLSNG